MQVANVMCMSLNKAESNNMYKFNMGYLYTAVSYNHCNVAEK